MSSPRYKELNEFILLTMNGVLLNAFGEGVKSGISASLKLTHQLS